MDTVADQENIVGASGYSDHKRSDLVSVVKSTVTPGTPAVESDDAWSSEHTNGTFAMSGDASLDGSSPNDVGVAAEEKLKQVAAVTDLIANRMQSKSKITVTSPSQAVPLGCCFEGTKASFGLWAPHATSVKVAVEETIEGELSITKHDLIVDGDVHSGILDGVHEGQAYWYEFESSWNDCYDVEGLVLMRKDPYARCTSTLCQKSYMTTTHKPTRKDVDWSKAAVYELHLPTFADKKSSEKSIFESARDKLSYIKDMGFNTVAMMPLQPSTDSWGYAPNLLMGIPTDLGTPKELYQLIDEAHSLGLSIICDVNINKGSVVNNCLWNFDGYGPNNQGGIFFENGVETGCGRTFDFTNDKVQEMILECVARYFKEFGCDAIRLYGLQSVPHELLEKITSVVKAEGGYLFGEVTPEDPHYCRDVGVNSLWIHSSFYDTIALCTNEEVSDAVPKMKSLIHPHDGFDKPQETVLINTGTHDQCGTTETFGTGYSPVGKYLVESLGGRDDWVARSICRTVWCTSVMSCGMPWMFMGTENHQGGWWNNHNAQAFDWKLVDDGLATNMRLLIKDSLVLSGGLDCVINSFTHEDGLNKVIGFNRGEHFIVIHYGRTEWADQTYKVKTPWNRRRMTGVFNSQAEEYGGWAGAWTREASTDSDGWAGINVPGYSVLVFKSGDALPPLEEKAQEVPQIVPEPESNPQPSSSDPVIPVPTASDTVIPPPTEVEAPVEEAPEKTLEPREETPWESPQSGNVAEPMEPLASKIDEPVAPVKEEIKEEVKEKKEEVVETAKTKKGGKKTRKAPLDTELD